MSDALRIERLEVRRGAVEAQVQVDPSRLRTSADPSLPAQALAIFPGLRGHTCRNSAGNSFADELADTEVAHLLEHAAVEVMALAGSRGVSGETCWDFKRDGRGVFHVSLTYDDDLVALGALKLAAAAVAWLLDGGEPPDVEAEVGRLRGLRRRQ